MGERFDLLQGTLDVLILRALPGVGESPQLGEAGGGIRVGGQREADELRVERDRVRQAVALPVVGNEEERAVALDRTAERAAHVVHLVGLLDVLEVIDRHVVGRVEHQALHRTG